MKLSTRLLTVLALLVVAVVFIAGTVMARGDTGPPGGPASADKAKSVIVAVQAPAKVDVDIGSVLIDQVDVAPVVPDGHDRLKPTRHAEVQRTPAPTSLQANEAPDIGRYAATIPEKRRQSTYNGLGHNHFARADV